MMIRALLAFFMILTGIAICQPRAVGIWLALAQGGYDSEVLKQMTKFSDDEFNDQKRYNP